MFLEVSVFHLKKMYFFIIVERQTDKEGGGEKRERSSVLWFTP